MYPLIHSFVHAFHSFIQGGGREVEIEVLTQDITRLFRKVEARLQQFGAGDATSEADEKVRMRAACTRHLPARSLPGFTTQE